MSIDLKKIGTAYTHSGRFHADDVFSAALLRIINPKIRFIRVNQLPDNTGNAIVFDIGGGRYDHHQSDAPIRENGMPYAAFGLLWKDLGQILTDNDAAERIDRDFISAMDAADNGIGTDNLSIAVSVMNPLWNENQDSNTEFEKAVDWAVPVLKRLILRENAKAEAYSEVRKALSASTGGIVILERFVPYEELLIPSDAVFVIYPSNREGYNISAVPIEKNSRVNKISFPGDWCNASDEMLPDMTGIKSFRFCHKNGFIAGTCTKEDAVRVAEAAISIFKGENPDANKAKNSQRRDI